MKYYALKYSLKVWLTSVLVSPVLFVLILCIRQTMSISEILRYGYDVFFQYLFFVIAQILFSFITWLIFWLFIGCITWFVNQNNIKTWLIFFTGILLTLGTFALISPKFNPFSDADGLINLMYANCLCIGWGVWYFKVETI